ncbi:hypothetical protein LTR37_002886 [Vermiconidia calcicola]|uniref:Uncharacterized protein n=1 Tax=Vermiconidia calcicola TaxID=1690605 RepID=A0ACC3NSX1_9PEZI|nr:hypothetical protein LTR37_002886 [Vermiconidia calcicola]
MPSINVRSQPQPNACAQMLTTVKVSLKENAGADQLEAAKKQVTDQGGKITHEFKLIKGFTADMPDDKVSTMQSNEHINVEADGKVTTQ